MNPINIALRQEIKDLQPKSQIIVDGRCYASRTVRQYASDMGRKLGRKFKTKRLNTGNYIIYRVA